MEIENNKTLWIFPNIKECVSYLPDNLQGRAWKLIIDYAFGDEKCLENEKNKRVLQTFFAVKPLLRLRKKAGSQNGESNNPSGLKKISQPNIAPNITPNINLNLLKTETETENKTETIKEKNKEFSEEFESFWKEYPKQRAGNKQKAYISYCRAIKDGRVTVDKMMQSVKDYAKSDEVKRGFAKGCQAWINDDRFNIQYKPEWVNQFEDWK